MADLEPRIQTEESVEEELQAKRKELLRGPKIAAQARKGYGATRNTSKPKYVYGPEKRKLGQINQAQKGRLGSVGNALGGCLFVIVVISIIVTVSGALIVAAPLILGFLLAVAGVLFVAAILVYILAAIFG